MTEPEQPSKEQEPSAETVARSASASARTRRTEGEEYYEYTEEASRAGEKKEARDRWTVEGEEVSRGTEEGSAFLRPLVHMQVFPYCPVLGWKLTVCADLRQIWL
jgi:hypothetical protein